jgi:hypothetical protein
MASHPREGNQAVGRAWLLPRMQPPVGFGVVCIRGWQAGGAVPSRLEASQGPGGVPSRSMKAKVWLPTFQGSQVILALTNLKFLKY